MTEKFCLKWNDFQTNVSNTFRKLRTSEHFYDVTLVSDDQQQVQAHKVVLSSSSEYFKNILTSNKHSHPMLCLSGVNKEDLKNILDFIYNGEIQIYQDKLDIFLDIAQRFQLEGLIQEKKEDAAADEMFKEEAFQENLTTDLITESNIVKTQPSEKIKVISSNYENLEELDQRLNEMLEGVADDGSKRICKSCGKMFSDVTNARRHAETHLEGLSFPCQHCNKAFRSRNSLRVHIQKCNQRQ